MGLYRGLYRPVQQLWDAGKSIFGGVVDWVRGAIEPGSPSKVFRYFGHMASLGMAEGILGGISDVERASGRMAGAAAVGITAPRIGSPHSAGGVASAGGGRRTRRPSRSRERPVVEVSIGGSRFQQEISNAVYEAIRRDILVASNPEWQNSLYVQERPEKPVEDLSE